MLGLSIPDVAYRNTSSLATRVNALFRAGEQGVWYDPSDISTLYQDAAGTTPVTAVEQPVGLILDKSGRGNHAYQSTSASRPVLSAQVNMLTYTEDLSNAAWVKAEASITQNAAVSPDGSMTADKFIPSANAVAHRIDFTFTATTAQCTTQVYVKLETGSAVDKITLYPGGISTFAHYNISANTTSKEANVVSNSITAVGNGWYKLQATWVAGTSIDRLRIYASSGSHGSAPTAGNGTSGIYIWGADLRPTNAGVNLPPYQRVGASTDYDTAGFPAYLKFDGIDDFLVTNSIDFTSTDKMTVCAGVRKLMDAASVAIFFELSANADTSNGAFVAYQYSTTDLYGLNARGTVKSAGIATSNAAYLAPVSSVYAGLIDISASNRTLRLNGTQVVVSSASMGTGNYGNYPLYIGSRAGTSLRYNGHIYSLIVRGAYSSDAQIASVERCVNSKTKAYA